MKLSNVINKFNPELSDESLELANNFFDLNKNLEKENKNILYIESLIEKEMNILKNKIKDVELKINTALFGSKKFINEAYAFEIPLNESYFLNPKTATFKDNVLTTKINETQINNKNPIDLKNILSKRNTDLKIINNVLNIEKNEYFNYQEIEINFPTNNNNGFIYIEFDHYENISLLDSYGKELIPRNITNKIRYPVSKDTKSITIRFHNNSSKQLILKEAYITQNNFELSTEIYTKPIVINKSLSQIGINTCDNYSEDNSDIKYEISINGKEFFEIRPLNKQKNTHINSIVSAFYDYSYYKLNKTNEDNYSLSDFDNFDFKIFNAYKYKLGDEIGLIQQEHFYFHLKTNYILIIHTNDSVTIDGINYVADKDNYEIKLNKGFHEITINESLWKQTFNILNYKVKEVITDQVKLETINDTEIIKVVSFDKNIKEKNSVFLQLIDKADIFLEKVTPEVLNINDSVVIKKTTNDNLHLYLKYLNNMVYNIQLKITLRSLNKNHPVYISSLTIRGI